MSAGCVHKKASVLLASGFIISSSVYGINGIEYAVGSLLGILLTPDLDVDAGNISNQIIRSRLGSWAEKGWDMLWYFYRRSIKHGSELSHAPVISTVFRLAYLFLFLLVVPYLILAVVLPGAWNVEIELRWWYTKIVEYHKVVFGLMGSDLIHWGLDILTTEHSKQKKQSIFGIPLASSVCR